MPVCIFKVKCPDKGVQMVYRRVPFTEMRVRKIPLIGGIVEKETYKFEIKNCKEALTSLRRGRKRCEITSLGTAKRKKRG